MVFFLANWQRIQIFAGGWAGGCGGGVSDFFLDKESKYSNVFLFLAGRGGGGGGGELF